MNYNIILNMLGLSFNILGALLIWKYGLPKNISREGHNRLIEEGINENEKIIAKKYDKCSNTGMILLIIGFFSQLLSLFFPNNN